jgi:cytochrome P450
VTAAALELASAITVADLDADPYPIYARLRRKAPVCYVPAVRLWLVARWRDVEYAATQPELFAAKPIPSPVDRTFGENNILTVDGEPQRRLRGMLDPSFRPRAVEEYAAPLVEPIVEEHLERIAGQAQAELMSEYFEPISVLSLGRVLGFGDVDGDTLRRWFHGLSKGATNFEDDPAKQWIGDATSAEIDAGLGPVFERLLAEPDGSTISNMLARAPGELEQRVAAIMPTLKVILLGGMQEPGHGAGSTVVGLLSHRGQAQALAADPAGLVGAAVEEGLRWMSPIGTQTRRVVADTELGGTRLPAGANVGLLVSSANRDEDMFGRDADRFDLLRRRRNHCAFGFGPHYCVGHHFSRVQIRIAIQRLFERLPGLELVPEEPPVLRGWEFRAPAHLHVCWDG